MVPELSGLSQNSHHRPLPNFQAFGIRLTDATSFLGFSSLQIASWSWDFSASITCEPIPLRNPPHIYSISVNPLGFLSLEKPWLTHCHFPREVPRPTGTSCFSSKARTCASQQLSFPGNDYGCLCCLEIPFGVFVLISPSSETVTRTLRKGPDGLGMWEFQFDN